MTLIAALLALLSAALTAGGFYLASTWLAADFPAGRERDPAFSTRPAAVQEPG